VLSQAFLLGKLRIKGSMGMAMKLSPIIEAAAPPPQSKL
jgi:putative sterol carrier protein